MAQAILLLKQGNTVETCLLLEWKKKKGDAVKKGEVVCVVETDKAVFEIESPADGILLDLFYEEGEDIPVLTNIAVVGKKGESYSEFLPGNSSPEVKIEEVTKKPETESVDTKENESKQPDLSKVEEGKGEKISPRAKGLAEKLEIPLEKIAGSGPAGRIIERDVLDYIKKMSSLSYEERSVGVKSAETEKEPYQALPEADISKIVPLKGVRKLIAERMLGSLRNSAQLTLHGSAEAVNLLDLRKKFKFGENYKSVTINDLIHYAVLKVLPNHPELNSALIGDKIYYYENIHLGFAVDTPRGLMVPVIRKSQKMNLLELSSEAKRLAEGCKNNRITMEELNGGTFTVTNLGGFGIESFTPVLNLPQTAILGVNTISQKILETEKGIEYKPCISFSLTIDHRVIDGAMGARFLQELASVVSKINSVIKIS